MDYRFGCRKGKLANNPKPYDSSQQIIHKIPLYLLLYQQPQFCYFFLISLLTDWFLIKLGNFFENNIQTVKYHTRQKIEEYFKHLTNDMNKWKQIFQTLCCDMNNNDLQYPETTPDSSTRFPYTYSCINNTTFLAKFYYFFLISLLSDWLFPPPAACAAFLAAFS